MINAETAATVAGSQGPGAMERVLLGNPVHAWLTAAAVFGLLLLAAAVLRPVLVARVRRWTSRTQASWDDALVDAAADLRVSLIAPAMLAVASSWLVLPPAAGAALRVLAVAGLGVQALLTSRLLVDAALSLLLRRGGESDETLRNSVGVLRFLVMLGVGVLVVLLALDNMGVKVTPMLAGLGVGGIAVALAVQNILGDVFASLSILLDKPFAVGDFIVVGDKMGTVERIGVKTTRVRALSGEQLVFANSDLLSSRIQNFKRMQERRAVFAFGIVYETPPAVVAGIPAMVREIVLAQAGTRFDRCHFKSFGACSLDFECVYYVTVADFNAYMDAQQAINLALLTRFAAAGIEFAYPTQVEIVRGEGPRRPV